MADQRTRTAQSAVRLNTCVQASGAKTHAHKMRLHDPRYVNHERRHRTGFHTIKLVELIFECPAAAESSVAYRCSTYVPGAAWSTGYPASIAPIAGGATGAPDRASSQAAHSGHHDPLFRCARASHVSRSEERRVGKECRTRWARYDD